MAALALGGPGSGRDGASARRRKSPITFGRVLVVVGIGLAVAIAYNMSSWQSVSDRPNEMKTTQVILPPPPPPPPPETKPIEQPPEPKMAAPVDQPLDTPPPPDQTNSDPTPGDNALTAREGAGPSNYGLAVGDGGGTRIGGKPGGGSGDAYRAYANVALGCVRAAAQRDRDLSRGRYSAALTVTMSPDGRFTNVRVSGVDDRRAAQLRELLAGASCQAPPAGLPAMRLELSTRSGG